MRCLPRHQYCNSLLSKSSWLQLDFVVGATATATAELSFPCHHQCISLSSSAFQRQYDCFRVKAIITATICCRSHRHCDSTLSIHRQHNVKKLSLVIVVVEKILIFIVIAEVSYCGPLLRCHHCWNSVIHVVVATTIRLMRFHESSKNKPQQRFTKIKHFL